MNRLVKKFSYAVVFLLMLFACTKDVGLVTEVEFVLTEQYQDSGFVNLGLSTSLSVVPEELLEDYEYFFTYSVDNGSGFYQDSNGERLPEGEKIPFDPLSVSINYIGTQPGEHDIRISAEDTFGFTEGTDLRYTISNVPVAWTAQSDVSQLLLTDTAPINVTLSILEDVPGITYERSYRISSGSGTLLEPNGDQSTLNDFVPIVPGNYELTFEPGALGNVVLEFVLRDSNEQESVASLELEVVEELTPVASIEVSPSNVSLLISESETLTATVLPVDAANTNVVWSSSDQSVATVSTTGEVTAIAEGTATVTATSVSDTTISDTSIITVTSDTTAVDEITVTPPSTGIVLGNTQQLTATITPGTATNQEVTWMSSDNTVASVDANGLVTSIAVGMATITATSLDNPSISGASNITVTMAEVAVTGLEVSPETAEIELGNAQQLNVDITPSTATNTNVTWSSSDENIATVDVNGLVTSIGTGVVTITAESVSNPMLSDTSEITIVAATVPVTGIEVTPVTVNMVNGGTAQLNAEITPNNATEQGVTWTSSNPSIATVDINGLVTAVSEGDVEIKAVSDDTTNGEISDTSSITVGVASIPVTAFSVTPETATRTEGETPLQLNVEITPNNATNTDVTWATDNPSVATVDVNGVVSTLSAGEAVVTATLNDDGNVFSDTSVITVISPNVDPTAGDDSYTVIENSNGNIFDILINDDDPDGNNALLRVISATNGINGTVSLGAGQQTVLYSPNTNFTGNDQFTYEIEDEDGGIATGTISVIVNPNQPPTVTLVDPILLPSGPFPREVTFSIASSDDPDGNIVSYEWNFGDTGSPGNSISNPNDSNVTYSYTNPGTYTITVTVTDNNGASGTDSMEIFLGSPATPGFTFNIDPVTGPSDGFPLGANVPITFRIQPNAEAVALGITFTMIFTDNSGSLQQFNYNSSSYLATQSFSVSSGTSSGSYEAPNDCISVVLEFTVSSNLPGLSPITRIVTFDVQGSGPCP